MQFLTIEESRAWAARHGFRVDPGFGCPVPTDVAAPLVFRIPPDASTRVVLVKTLWEAVGEGTPEVLIWVTDSSVWPSGEHLPLAEAARRGIGAVHSLDETPGHLVRLGEDQGALSILCLAALFLWDCWVLPAAGRPAVFISHDEYGLIDTRGDEQGLRRRLDMLGLVGDNVRVI